MDDPAVLQPWSVVAVNLPEHAFNTIHTDAGAQAAGYPAALVAGVTTYAYLTHPCVVAWGLEWVGGGGGELRLRAPVFAGDRVDCVPTAGDAGDDEGAMIEAICPAQERNPRATFAAVRTAGPVPSPRPGRRLRTSSVMLSGEFGFDYGLRAGDDLDLFGRERLVHPAVWPALANRVYATQLVNGPWIHTRSVIRHHAVARAGSTVDVDAVVVDEFERGGRRVVCDVVIRLGDVVVATVEHEAIVELAPG